jgi:hypothetical protein
MYDVVRWLVHTPRGKVVGEVAETVQIVWTMPDPPSPHCLPLIIALWRGVHLPGGMHGALHGSPCRKFRHLLCKCKGKLHAQLG